MGDFIAFQAAVSLLKKISKKSLLDEVYAKCKAQESLPKEEVVNYVKEVYKPFTADQIAKKIVKLLTPKDMQAEVDIIYQSIENLHSSCPNHQETVFY